MIKTTFQGRWVETRGRYTHHDQAARTSCGRCDCTSLVLTSVLCVRSNPTDREFVNDIRRGYEHTPPLMLPSSSKEGKRDWERERTNLVLIDPSSLQVVTNLLPLFERFRTLLFWKPNVSLTNERDERDERCFEGTPSPRHSVLTILRSCHRVLFWNTFDGRPARLRRCWV